MSTTSEERDCGDSRSIISPRRMKNEYEAFLNSHQVDPRMVFEAFATAKNGDLVVLPTFRDASCLPTPGASATCLPCCPPAPLMHPWIPTHQIVIEQEESPSSSPVMARTRRTSNTAKKKVFDLSTLGISAMGLEIARGKLKFTKTYVMRLYQVQQHLETSQGNTRNNMSTTFADTNPSSGPSTIQSQGQNLPPLFTYKGPQVLAKHALPLRLEMPSGVVPTYISNHLTSGGMDTLVNRSLSLTTLETEFLNFLFY